MTEDPAHTAVQRAITHPDQVLDELARREPLTHRGDCGTTRADFEAMTAEDFWEVGASGNCYDRDFIWSVLQRRNAEPGPDPWETSELRCRQLSMDTYLVTYLLRQGERLTRRATVWQQAEGGWQVIYHQGTMVSDV